MIELRLKTSDQRAMRRAAELLEEEAAVIHESFTHKGLWGADRVERLRYNEMRRIAARLREIAQ